MGYSIEEVKKGMMNENSNIHQLYAKLADDKKIHFSPIYPSYAPSMVSSYNSPTSANNPNPNTGINALLRSGVLKGRKSILA